MKEQLKQEELKIEIEDYAKFWQTIELDRSQYTYGEKNFMRIMLLCSQVKIKQEGWNYWMNKLDSSNKIEQHFCNTIIKYRTPIRRAIQLNSLQFAIQNGETNELVTNKKLS